MMELLGHSLQCVVCTIFCKSVWKSVLIFISVLAAIDLSDKNLQMSDRLCLDGIGDKFEILLDAYRKMLDQSFSKSDELGDMLSVLPGVVVQKEMSKQGVVDLYRIEPDLLERLIESTIEPLRSSDGYILDAYLSCFLQDQDRSGLYYCDPMLQNISICRHVLSLMSGSDAFDFQSY